MTSPRRPRHGSSWLGTFIVTVAIIVICWRAAASLRRSIAPASADSPASAAPPITILDGGH
jgi:hypothetical protein